MMRLQEITGDEGRVAALVAGYNGAGGRPDLVHEEGDPADLLPPEPVS